MTASKVAPAGGEARVARQPHRRLRVLVVTSMWPSTERPAYGSFVAAQVESLRATGAEMDVLVIPGDRHPAAYFTSVARVRSRVRRTRPDVVHAHYGLAGWTASWQPLPLVISYCGTDLLGARSQGGVATPKSRLATMMSQSAAGRAGAIICKSENLRQALRDPRDRARAHVIPNGVDLRKFTPGDQAAARQRLGLPAGGRQVLLPYSAASANKRVGLVRTVVERVRASDPDVSLVEVSGVPSDRMPDYYRAADCLVLASHAEGSPNVVKEALACGLPVVSVDVGDVRRWLDHVPGCAVVPDDPDVLAGAVARTLRDRSRVDASAVLSQLDQDSIAQEVLQVYHALTPA